LLTESHCILNRLKDYLCQLLSVHGVNDVRQTEIRISYIPEINSVEAAITIENMRRYKSQGTNQIPSNSHLHKVINSVWNKEVF
jgi:hypothetical protein